MPEETGPTTPWVSGKKTVPEATAASTKAASSVARDKAMPPAKANCVERPAYPKSRASSPIPPRPSMRVPRPADLSVASADALRQAPQTFSRGNAFFSTSRVRTPPAES